MHFRIQHLQWLGALVAAVACLALGALSLSANLADYSRYQQGGQQLSRFHSVLAAANAVSAERGPANSAMGGPDAARGALSAALAAKRAETNRRLDEMEARFTAESTGLHDIRDQMIHVRASLAAGRAAVDAVAALPFDLRDGQQVAAAINAMFAAADSVLGLRDRLGREIVRSTPQVGTQVIINATAGMLREQTGRLGSYVVMMLTSDHTDEALFRARFSETLTRIAEARRLLAGYAGAAMPGGAIDRAIVDMDERYFAGSLPYAQAIARRDGQPGSPTADAFTNDYVPGMRPVEQLRELVAAASQAAVDDMRDKAQRLVFASAALTGIAILALTFIALIFRDGLFRPLITARQQIMAIAHGDLSEPPPVWRASREMRDMFQGLDVLRDQQRYRLDLEHDQRRMAEQLRHLSETDMLTGLLNRRAINDMAATAFLDADQDGFPLAVILFDIDHFKSINDSHGHAVGDAVLRNMAAVKPLLRSGDAVARYGGEEFIVLLHDVTEDEATALAERLRERIGQPMPAEGVEIAVTGSFGVALRESGSATTWDSLVATADRRLYRAKQAGRNRVCASDGTVASPPLAPDIEAPARPAARREAAGRR